MKTHFIYYATALLIVLVFCLGWNMKGNELEAKKQQEYFITKNHSGHDFEILIDSKGEPVAFDHSPYCQNTSCKFRRYDK